VYFKITSVSFLLSENLFSVKTFHVSSYLKIIIFYEYHPMRVFYPCLLGGEKYAKFHSLKTEATGLMFVASKS